VESRIRWPEGKDFAFTIFDDTDFATLDNVRPVYDFLEELGLRTTKSVWPLRPTAEVTSGIGGSTCEDADYLDWLLSLQAKGFEIGLHNATSHSSRRGETVRGIERFRELFGDEPITLATHTGNREGMYFGADRLTGARAHFYDAVKGMKYRGFFQGHVPSSEYFWGDVCKETVKYVRNFVFDDIDTLACCPFMPYHDPRRPYVNYWFASSQGATAARFNRTIGEADQDRLAARGGACIMYTHFACGFYDGSALDAQFERLMRRLSRMNGWFVPVRVLLDHLMSLNGPVELTDRQRSRLEWKWLLSQIRGGRTYGTILSRSGWRANPG
jgi:hypothetical protein